MEMEASFLPAPAQQESAASAAKTPSRRALRAAPTIDTSPQGDGATPRASRNANFKRRKKCEDEKQAYLQAVRQVHGDGGGKHTEEEVLISNMTNHEAKRMYRAIHKHFPHITLSRDTKRMQNIEERKKLREKRQDPLHCADCAAKYAATGGTQRIFQLCRTFEKAGRAKGVGQASQMPTSNSLSEWGATLSQAACRDLQFRATPEGLSVSIQSAVELMVHQHETTPPSKPRKMRRNGTMKMPAQETIPARNPRSECDASRFRLWRIIKISLDARDVNKSPLRHHTEVMTILMDEGEEGELICQMVLRIKTVALWSGKDTPDLVDRNFSALMNDMHKLESNGIVYDHTFDTYYGVLDGLHERYGADNVRVHLDVDDLLLNSRTQIAKYGSVILATPQ